jgi:hypothetical protein
LSSGYFGGRTKTGVGIPLVRRRVRDSPGQPLQINANPGFTIPANFEFKAACRD